MDKTTEALHAGVTGPDGVAAMPGGRIVAIQGPEFLEKYMTNMIVPRRQELVAMIIAQQVGITGQTPVLSDDAKRESMVRRAYALADEVLLQERATLDDVVSRYWEVFMTRDKRTDDVMKTLIEESQDYHL